MMPNRREGIMKATGFGFACIDTQASQFGVYCLTKVSFFSLFLKTVTETINLG